MVDCLKTVGLILNLFNIKYTQKYLKDSLFTHPDFPSLLAVRDSLNEYKIESLAVKIDFNKIKEIPLPCIVQLGKNNSSSFNVLKSVNKDKVTLYQNNKKVVEYSKEDFINIWSGICLLVQPSNESKEIGIERKILEKRIVNFLKISLTLFFLFWVVDTILVSNVLGNYLSISLLGYTFLKMLGVVSCVFLLWFEIDQYNPVIQNLCSRGNKKINCNAVLNSKYSKLLKGNISLSILGFSYFFSTFFYLVFYNFLPDTLLISYTLSIATVPIVLFSVYYQALVIKTWCKFCVVVQIVLLGEVMISLVQIDYNFTMSSITTIPFLLLILFLPILIWSYLKPILNEEKEKRYYKKAYRRMKNDVNVFNSLLSRSKKIKTPTENLGIRMSHKSSKYNVIKVCNPYCEPCAKAHPVLEELVNTGLISLQILFTASTNRQDYRAKPVKHFLAINQNNEIGITQKALSDWYNLKDKNYEVFAEKYPVNGELKEQNDKINAMYNWCESENIAYTPTIFINNYELPKLYNVEDLKDMLI